MNLTKNPEIEYKRLFDVPRERVFEAFADQKQLALWWGPKSFTNTISRFEFRPGGRWEMVMHGPDGKDYPNEAEFVEVAPARVVFRHFKPDFQLTMLFGERAGKAELSWRMRWEGPLDEKLRVFLASKNEENFDRLEVYLK